MPQGHSSKTRSGRVAESTAPERFILLIGNKELTIDSPFSSPQFLQCTNEDLLSKLAQVPYLPSRSATGRCWMGQIPKLNLVPTLNLAAICAALAFVGAIVAGVF